jgi:hypothetical protein
VVHVVHVAPPHTGLDQCSVTHGDTTSPPNLRVEFENSSPLGAAIELH